MRKIILFNLITVDGYFEGPDANINWHNVDQEFNGFAIAQMKTADTLLFGRKTYELMAGYWPMEEAIKNDEENAEYRFLRLVIQENAPKIVKYRGNIENDTEIIRASFKKLAPVVQQAITDYSKKSTFLKPTDF